MTAEAAAAVQKIADEAAAIRAAPPKEMFLQALAELPGSMPRTFLLARGDYQEPRQELSAGRAGHPAQR